MTKTIRSVIHGLARNESGSALILVLVLLVLGSLVVVPALANVGTVLKTGARYEEKTDALYAADAGIEDAICQIKNDQLPYVLAGQGYHRYAYGENWSYDLGSPVNDLTTTVTIHNVWIPKQDSDTGIEPPSDPEEVAACMALNKLMVSGTSDNSSGYEISISFTPETGDNLTIKSMGIWLPFGFGYVAGSSNLEDDMFSPSYDVPVVFDHAGGRGVVWDFAVQPPIAAFPNYNGGTGSVQTIRIDFDYSANETGAKPAAIAWMETEDYSVIDDILPVTWDIDTSVFGVASTAGDTEIEAYLARYELRNLDGAIAGDYKATGNSLMICDHSGSGIRDTLLSESDATVSSINAAAVVTQAYLYWAAWFDETRVLDENCEDFTDNAWTRSDPSGWNASYSGSYGWRYAGHSATAEGDPQRYLTSKTLNLSGKPANAVVEVRWDQREAGTLESTDILQYQFYGNGQWSELYTAFADDIDETSLRFTNDVPPAYWAADFKLRFYFQGFTDTAGTDEYCYIDNIAVTWYVPTADTSAKFEINGVQVYLDGDGNPQQGLVALTATPAEQGFVDNRRGYSYRIKKDVTKLVQAYTPNGSPEHLAGNGNATYTVGNVTGNLGDQLAWGGWSIILIYSHPEAAGHRLYLFDRFAFNQGYENLDFDFDGIPGGDIDGFIVPDPIEGDADPYAGHMTCFVGEGDDFITGDKLKFTGQSANYMYLTNGTYHWYNVWNMHSPGMSFDGVDVDTFEIPWENGSAEDLVVPGDTTAHLDLPSETTGGYDGSDAWNMVYLILSLRSLTTTSGTTHYVIHNY
jgi:hypothetical protein